MNNERLETFEELRQLKEDYSALKKELEEEKIINERLMDSAFKHKVRTIINDKKITLVAGTVAAVVQPIIGFLFSAPFKYTAILEIFILALIVVNIVFYLKYDLNKIQFSDVLNASRTIKNYKKSYTHLTVIEWVVVIALIMSFCPRIIEAWSTPVKATFAIVFLAIVVTVCLFADFCHSKKIIDSCDSIIKDLDGCDE